MKFDLTALSRLDLLDIEEIISRDNPWRAESFITELLDKMTTIGERPLSFPVWHSDFPDFRSAGHGRYLILFRIVEGRPRIERVIHTARDIAAILDDDI